MKTNFFHLLLFIPLFFLSISLSAETITATSYAGGDGSEANPYQISNLAELRRLSETAVDLDKRFVQTADIDASDTKTWNIGDHDGDETTPDEPMGFSPIGTAENPFTGEFDGGGCVIENLKIDLPDTDNVGLFGVTQNAEISNLKLVSCDITGATNVGGLIGKSEHTVIKRCSSSGRLSGSELGGLLGVVMNSTVEDCFSNAMVDGKGFTGGFVGVVSDSVVRRCYATGLVRGGLVDESYLYGLIWAGGFSGRIKASEVDNCYATGSVVCGGVPSLGAFCALAENTKLTNCYATGAIENTSGPRTADDGRQYISGGFGLYDFHWDDNTVLNCFWDEDVNQHPEVVEKGYDDGIYYEIYSDEYKPLATALTSGQFLSKPNFVSCFDMLDQPNEESPWAMKHGVTRPFFSWQNSYVRTGKVFKNSEKNSFYVEDSYVYNNSDKKIVETGFVCHAEQVFPSEVRKEFVFGKKIGLNINANSGCTIAGINDVSIDPSLSNIDSCYVCAYAKNSDGEVYYGDSVAAFFINYGGKGSAESPYEIKELEDLSYLSRHPEIWDKHFIMTNDIDASETENSNFFRRLYHIGERSSSLEDGTSGDSFSGVFDGNGYTISNFRNCYNISMFWGVNGEIRNLGVVGCDNRASALVGYLEEEGVVKNCYATGQITNSSVAGGLVCENYGKIVNSYFSGAVEGKSNVGGLIAINYGDVSNCYSLGSVAGDDTVGGFVGYTEQTIFDSYSASVVSFTESGGGFAGGRYSSYKNTATFENCYWDIGVSGQEQSGITGDGLPIGLTTDEFVNFDFSTVWNMRFENGIANISPEFPWVKRAQDVYPVLYWQLDYFASDEMFEPSESGLELFKSELIKIGVSNIDDEKLLEYQWDVFINLEMIYQNLSVVQEIISSINGDTHFLSSTVMVSNGWNMISSPYEGWAIKDSDLLNRYGDPHTFSYSGGKYVWHHESEDLMPGVGYWIYIEGLVDGEEYPVVISGTESSRTVHEKVGWSLVGPVGDDQSYMDFAFNIFCWDILSEKYELVEEEPMKLGYGYWMFCD